MIRLSPHLSTIKSVPASVTSEGGSAIYVSDESDAVYDDNPQPVEVANADTPEPTIRHPEFFFDNTLIAIKIENTLFNVHKYQLAKSDFFSEIFKLSNPKGNKPEKGTSPEDPILIQGTHASDFAALLRVLYASHFSSNPPVPDAALVVPAFRLASLLNFSELRTYLLPLAEKNLDDVDKIVFAREFGIREWLAPAYIRICLREAVLSTEEARKLEVDSVLLIWSMREQYGNRRDIPSGGHYCTNCISRTTGGSTFCNHCRVYQTQYYFSGAAMTGTRATPSDSSLETEVKKWVEEDCAARR